MSDEVFIQGLKKGIPSFQERFVQENYKNVLHQSYQILKNKEDAEDAAQLTFLKAFRAIKTYKGDAKINVWLYAIARFEALMILRKNKTKPTLHYEAKGELKRAVYAQGYSYTNDPLLRRKMARILSLTKNKWRGTLLAKMHEFTDAEIAAIHGQTLAAVKCDVHRARVEYKHLFKKAV